MHVVATRLFFSCLIAFSITWYIVPILSQVARKLGVIDVPDGKIKNHKKPTPYLGGLAVYIGFLVSLAFVAPFHNSLFLPLIGSTILLFVGLIDDVIVLTPAQKFFGQGVAVFCFLKLGLLSKIDFFAHHIWYVPLSALWILTIVNAFNLVDVMDGLATLIAMFATAGFIGAALITGVLEVVYILGAFLGALGGFFCHNKPPAKVYLGDAGSLFIGGVLATIPFVIPWGTCSSYGLYVPFLFLSIPLAEVIMLVVVRTWLKIPFYKASPHHFSLVLQRRGWSKLEILITTGILSLFVVSCGLLYLALCKEFL